MTYLDETTTVSRWYEDPDFLEPDQDDPSPRARNQTGIEDSICARGLPDPASQDVAMTTGGPSPPIPLDEVGNGRARPYAMLNAVTPVHDNYNRALLADTPRTESSAFHGSPESSSSRSYSTVYPLSVTPGPAKTILTQREAVLMRNFTDHMALWVSMALRSVLSSSASL